MEKLNKTREAYEIGMIQITDPNKLPSGKHYAIMVYVEESHSTYEPPWHERDKGVGSYYTEKYIQIQHWVTTNEEVWKQKILELETGRGHTTKQKYVAFVVDKVANVKLNVNVDVRIN